MATLDLDTSDESGGYSDSFELEESISLDPADSPTETETKNDVISRLKQTLNDTRVSPNKLSASTSRSQAETKADSTITSRNGIQKKSIKLDSGDSIDLGMTIRSPMKLESDEPNVVSHSGSSSKPSSKFKKVAQNVKTMQSVVNTAKNFNDSLEVRDTVYSEWLARKKTQVSRDKSVKVTAKRAEEEAKRKKEVGNSNSIHSFPHTLCGKATIKTHQWYIHA